MGVRFSFDECVPNRPPTAAEVAASLGDGPGRDTDRVRLGGCIDDPRHLARFTALVGERFVDDEKEISHGRIPVSAELWKFHAQHWGHGCAPPFGGRSTLAMSG